MGKEKEHSFLHEWQEVGGPDSGIVRETNTGREGERRIIALDPIYSPSNEQYIYNYRRETQLPFVNAYGSEVLKLEKLTKADKKDKNRAKELKDPYKHLAVITERIPHRLVDAPQLTYPEALYVLDRALEGYETAYQKVGPFRVNDRLIGFNNQGQAKVWVNEDFANNHPSYPIRRLMSTRTDSREFLQGRYNSGFPVAADEADMVQDVVNTVQNYSEEGLFQEPFHTQINQRLSFADARRLLHTTITQNRIPVPDRVDLFTNRVRGYRKVTSTTKPGQLITTTTTENRQSTQGYRFNYLPVDRPYEPDIFASRVGEHGVYKGRHY